MNPLFDHEQYNDHPALYYPKLAAVIGLNESIFLAQLHYWLEQSKSNPNLGRWADGRNWIFNSYENWQAQNFPFWSQATVKRTANSVVKMKLALKRNDLHAARFQYNQTLFWSIDYDQLAALVKEAFSTPPAVTESADDSAALGNDLTNEPAAEPDQLTAPGDDLTNEPAAEPDQLTAPGDTQQVNLTNCANNAITTGQFAPIQQVNLTRYNRSICTDTTGQFDQIPETTSKTTSENTFRDETTTTTPAPKNGNTAAASPSLNGGSGSGFLSLIFNESDFLNFYDRYASRPNRFGLNTAQTRKIETAYAILGPDRFWVAMEKSLTTNPRQTVTAVISSLTVAAAENEAAQLAPAEANGKPPAQLRPGDDPAPASRPASPGLHANSTNGQPPAPASDGQPPAEAVLNWFINLHNRHAKTPAVGPEFDHAKFLAAYWTLGPAKIFALTLVTLADQPQTPIAETAAHIYKTAGIYAPNQLQKVLAEGIPETPPPPAMTEAEAETLLFRAILYLELDPDKFDDYRRHADRLIWWGTNSAAVLEKFSYKGAIVNRIKDGSKSPPQTLKPNFTDTDIANFYGIPAPGQPSEAPALAVF